MKTTKQLRAAPSLGWRDSVEKIGVRLGNLKGSAPREGSIFINFYLAGATWSTTGSRCGAKRIRQGAPLAIFSGEKRIARLALRKSCISHHVLAARSLGT